MSTRIYDRSSEAGREEIPTLVDPLNYAKYALVSMRFRDQVLERLPEIKNQRRSLEERWERQYQLWNGKPSVQLYKGGTKLSLPIARRIVETFVNQLQISLFPTDGNFEVMTEDMMVLPAADVARRLIQNECEQAELEVKMPGFLRQGLLHGPAVAKIGWLHITAQNYRLRGMLDKNLAAVAPGAQDYGFVPEESVIYEGTTFKPVDIMKWGVHPFTALDWDEVELVWEDMEVDRAFLLGMEKAGLYHNVKRVWEKDDHSRAADHDTVQSDSARNTRLSPYGLTIEQVKAASRGIYTLTEIWGNFDLYGTGEHCACQIAVCNGVILQIRQNPFLDQMPPYLMWRCIDTPDNFYGQGIFETIETMNYMADAIASQAIDSVRFQTNHIIMYDRMRVPRADNIKVKPRALWAANGNPKDVFDIFTPPDNSQGAINILQLITSMMMDTAGAPPILQGKIGSKEITATEADILKTGAAAGTNAMVRKVEAQVLSPWLRRAFQRNQQFRPFKQHVEIAGAPPLQLDPASLARDLFLRWKTSTQVSGRLAELQMDIQRAQAETAKMQLQQQAQMMAAQQMVPGMGAAPGMPGPGPDMGMAGASPTSGLQNEASLRGTEVPPTQSFGGI